jgi:hypothetical protein
VTDLAVPTVQIDLDNQSLDIILASPDTALAQAISRLLTPGDPGEDEYCVIAGFNNFI